MEDDQLDKLTPEEISSTRSKGKKQLPKKGKPVVGKLLIVFVVIVIILVGFVFVQKTLLDLEAQAQISAVQTYAARTPIINTPIAVQPFLDETPTVENTETTTAVMPTENSDFVHTATIAAQLTGSAH